MSVSSDRGVETSEILKLQSLNGHLCSRCRTEVRPFLCELSIEAQKALTEITEVRYRSAGGSIFQEGQPPCGIFILCNGRAKLTINSRNGRSLMWIAEPGDILGLSATITGRPYEVSADLLDSGELKFIGRENFLSFLHQHGQASLRAIEYLSRDYLAVHDQVRVVALSNSVAEKLARLLLAWCDRNGKSTEEGIKVKLPYTHGEIAQMIGISRETVTRLLSELKSKKIIHLNGSNLFVKNRDALESLVNS